MSCGLVICSACRRELEQTGPRSVENGWRHLDGSPRCLAATTDYPQCEAQMSDGSRCTENALKSCRETFQSYIFNKRGGNE